MSKGYRFVLLTIAICLAFSLNLIAQGQQSSSTSVASPNLGVQVATPPTVITQSATHVTHSSAELNGLVNPNGFATQYFFEWGWNTAYGQVTDTFSLGPVISNTAVVCTLSSLDWEYTYYYRLVAISAEGITYGSGMSFTTLTPPPTIATFPPTDITMTSAEMGIWLYSPGQTVSGWFEYGNVDSVSTYSDTMTTFESGTWYYQLVNLFPGATYRYAGHAQNAFGSSTSPFAYYTTLASPEEYLPDEYTLALYHFNESRDEIQDYSDYHNFAYVDTNWRASSVEGRFGNCRNLTVPYTSIKIPASASLDLYNSDFTIEMWVNPQLYGNSVTLLSQGYSFDSSKVFELGILSGRNLFFSMSEDGFTDHISVTTDSPMVDYQWQHIAVVVDNTEQEVRFYHNGRLQTTTSTGTFPTTVFSSTHPIIIGEENTASKSSAGGVHFKIDELRISDTKRKASDFSVKGSLIGMKYHDINGNRQFDGSDSALANWKIQLKQIHSAGGNPPNYPNQMTTTNQFGAYAFTGLPEGEYLISEVQEYGWVQTFPSGAGKHTIYLNPGEHREFLDFGNTKGYVFLGGVDNTWSNPANWEGGILPTESTFVYLNGPVVFDLPTETTIGGLSLGPNGSLTIGPGAGELYVSLKLEIDGSGQLILPTDDMRSSSKTGGFSLYCDGDFINHGLFDAGTSTVYMSGANSELVHDPQSSFKGKTTRAGILAKTGNQFYNLNITGSGVSTSGNVIVTNNLTLTESLTLREQDTVYIENTASDAIVDNGRLYRGSVRRAIANGSTSAYRFESANSFVQFDGSNTPDAITMTSKPGELPDTSYFKWKEVSATFDSVTNTFNATGVNHFSKWVFGRPGSGLRSNKLSGQDIIPQVSRSYVIKAEGNLNFNATLQLRFEDDDYTDFEDGLKLARGAYYTDSVYNRWNMVSLPVIPDYFVKDSVFPNSSSNAFRFNNGYVADNNLTFGTGYWLKFPGDDVVSILGNDEDSVAIPVTEGWNMLGSISYPVDPTNTYLVPTGGGSEQLNTNPFFGYRNGYQIVDELKPLRAYWVKINSEGTLLLDKDFVPTKQVSVASLLKQSNTLLVKDAEGMEQPLYFSFNNSIDAAKFDMPPAPPTGILNARFTSGRMLETLGQQESKTIPVTISSSALPVTVSWNIADNSGSATLIVDGKEIALRGNSSVTISSPNAKVSLRLSSVPTNGLPTQFALYQNYPNPFNPSTTLAFDLPNDEQVSLIIYNILGQEVMKVLENVEMKAGYHTQQLNTSGWASGVYFYKLNAGAYSNVMKMVLAR